MLAFMAGLFSTSTGLHPATAKPAETAALVDASASIRLAYDADHGGQSVVFQSLAFNENPCRQCLGKFCSYYHLRKSG